MLWTGPQYQQENPTTNLVAETVIGAMGSLRVSVDLSPIFYPFRLRRPMVVGPPPPPLSPLFPIFCPFSYKISI